MFNNYCWFFQKYIFLIGSSGTIWREKNNLIAVLALKHAKATGGEWSLDPPRIATIRNDKII